MAIKYYCYCKECKYEETGTSIADVRAKIEQHENEEHNGKLVGVFGKEEVES